MRTWFNVFSEIIFFNCAFQLTIKLQLLVLSHTQIQLTNKTQKHYIIKNMNNNSVIVRGSVLNHQNKSSCEDPHLIHLQLCQKAFEFSCKCYHPLKHERLNLTVT